MDLKQAFQKAAPTILSVLASIGVVATAVSAIKAQQKVEEDKEFYADEKKLYIKHYAPTVLIGASTIACIAGANGLSRKNQAMVLSAYAFANESYKQYVNTVKDIYGEDTHRHIVAEIAKSQCEIPHLTGATGFSRTSLDIGKPELTRTFYDAFSKRYFDSTMSAVVQAEYHLNRNYVLGADPTVNDWYDFLGLEHIDCGDEYKWDICSGFYWIDFNHSVFKLDNGADIVMINMPYEPEMIFEEDLNG